MITMKFSFYLFDNLDFVYYTGNKTAVNAFIPKL